MLRAQSLGFFFFFPLLHSVAAFTDKNPKAQSFSDLCKVTELIRREAGLELDPELLQDGSRDSMWPLLQGIDLWLWKTKLISSAERLSPD